MKKDCSLIDPIFGRTARKACKNSQSRRGDLFRPLWPKGFDPWIFIFGSYEGQKTHFFQNSGVQSCLWEAAAWTRWSSIYILFMLLAMVGFDDALFVRIVARQTFMFVYWYPNSPSEKEIPYT